MSHYKLIYFPVRGKGEAMRLLFWDQNVKFEEETVTRETWGALKPKMAYGQLPCLVIDGQTEIVQSNAILRCLARKHGLYGASDEEATFIDMLNDGQDDLRQLYVRMIYTNYEEGKEPYIKELPNYLEKFEKLLKKNNDGTGYFVGSKVSFADYNMLDLLDIHLVLAPGCLDAFPCLKAFHQRMLAQPGIAKYRESEGFKKRPINGNDKQ